MSEDEGDDAGGDTPPREPASGSNDTAVGVGYKHPPRHTRFKKGQSGNPKGRPKARDIGIGGSRSATKLVLKEAERTIPLTDNSGTRDVTAIEAAIRAEFASAVKGSAYAQRNFIDRYERAERERRQQIKEEIEKWERYIANWHIIMAAAERKGEAPPTLLPHPDDIVLDRETGVRFTGPILEEDLIKLEKDCKVRDVLLMQYELDRREAGDKGASNPLDGANTALLYMYFFNQSVPARYQLTDWDIAQRMGEHKWMTKRELLKTLYRAWRDLGVPVRRGKTSPSLRVVWPRLKFEFELMRRLTDGSVDLDNATDEEIEALSIEVWQETQCRSGDD